MKGETFLLEYEQDLAGEEEEMSQDEGMLLLFKEKWVGSAPPGLCVWREGLVCHLPALVVRTGGSDGRRPGLLQGLTLSHHGAEGCRTSLGYLGWWSTDQLVRWPVAFAAMTASVGLGS